MTVADLIAALEKCPSDAIVYVDEDGIFTDDYEPELRTVDVALYDSIVDSPNVNVQPKLGDVVVLL